MAASGEAPVAKRKQGRAGSPHRKRPELKARHPVHVVLRVVAAVGNLRRRCAYKAVREATLTTARREDFRVVHLSIQRNHLHLLVEADDRHALAVGMQGFQISAAKHLNREISKTRPGPRRRGAVFPDRYHAEIITTPTQARNALSTKLSSSALKRGRHSLPDFHAHQQMGPCSTPAAAVLIRTVCSWCAARWCSLLWPCSAASVKPVTHPTGTLSSKHLRELLTSSCLREGTSRHPSIRSLSVVTYRSPPILNSASSMLCESIRRH
jgi:REP element-mobilizing transposase RayT